MNILFWQWDHGKEHPIAVRQLIKKVLESAEIDKDKIGGLYGSMPELSFEELQQALSLRDKRLDFYYSLNEGYKLNLEYYPEYGFGYARVVRLWGKNWRRVGLSMKWTEEIQIDA